MLAIRVKARAKPGQTENFLKAIEHDALGSECDEPGCLRYAVWRAAADTLDGPAEPIRCATVFPADRGYWGKV